MTLQEELIQELKTLAQNAIDMASDEQSAQKAFEPIAKILLNKCLLNSETGKFRIVEIEFYLNTEKHNDTIIRNNERQKEFGEWYVHRRSKSKDGEFAANQESVGIDLTLGSPNQAFGVLLRALQNTATGETNESGPVRTLNTLYPEKNKYNISEDKSDYKEYSKKVESHKYGAFDNPGVLYLIFDDALPQKKIKWEPRTIASINENKHPDWWKREYKAKIDV
jgi:hypothetical protein